MQIKKAFLIGSIFLVTVALALAADRWGVSAGQPKPAASAEAGSYAPPSYTVEYSKLYNAPDLSPEETLSMEKAAAVGVGLLAKSYGVDLNNQTINMIDVPYTQNAVWLEREDGIWELDEQNSVMRPGWRGTAVLPDGGEGAWYLAFHVLSGTDGVLLVNRTYTSDTVASDIHSTGGAAVIDTLDNFKPIGGQRVTVSNGLYGLERFDSFPERYDRKTRNFAKKLKEENNGYTELACDFAVSKGFLPDAAGAECVGLSQIRVGTEYQDNYVVYVSVASSNGHQLIFRFLSDTKEFLGAEVPPKRPPVGFGLSEASQS